MKRESDEYGPSISTRYKHAIWKRMEARVAKKKKERPESHVSMSDVIRELVFAGLEATQKEEE